MTVQRAGVHRRQCNHHLAVNSRGRDTSLFQRVHDGPRQRRLRGTIDHVGLTQILLQQRRQQQRGGAHSERRFQDGHQRLAPVQRVGQLQRVGVAQWRLLAAGDEVNLDLVQPLASRSAADTHVV